MGNCSQLANEMALAFNQVFDIGSVYGGLVFAVGGVVGWCVGYVMRLRGEVE